MSPASRTSIAVRFDDTELYSNTNELELSITNRSLTKRRSRHGGGVSDLAALAEALFRSDLWRSAVQARRQQLQRGSQRARADAFRVSGPAAPLFADGFTLLRVSPRPGFGRGVAYRLRSVCAAADLSNSGFTADAPLGDILCSPWDTALCAESRSLSRRARTSSAASSESARRTGAVGTPASEQLRLPPGVMLYATTQVTYNTDCCGFSVQYRRFGFGTATRTSSAWPSRWRTSARSAR